ncbi:MAG: hypothetical protein CMH36_14260 [Microbacterium sp.]|nr:hypothetical protein [Microbacterium sp.]MCK9917252.1 hypothetical protein [Microbacteriaceae bacterium K1510]
MLNLDPEGPIPLDVLCALGAPPVSHAVSSWRDHGIPTPISGDPHFVRRTIRHEVIDESAPEGWFPLGYHAGTVEPLQFSAEVDGGGLPLWERPVPSDGPEW